MADDTADRWDAVEEASELLLLGQDKLALVMLKRVIADDPANHYAYYYIGVTMQQLDQKEAARDAYRAAVKLSPGYLAARIALSHALRELNYLDGAITQALEGLERFPNDGDLLNVLGAMAPDEAERRKILVDNPTRLYFE